MGRFKFNRALFGLTTVTAAVSIFAADQLLDDHSDGTNENEFEKYWYYYDDFAGTKDDDRPAAGPTTTPSEIKVPYKEKEIELDNGNKHTMKDYTFTLDSLDGNKFATMPFKYGEQWTASYGKASPFVGLGTGLASDRIDLTGATGVRFKMRSRGEPLTVTFQVETKTILERKSFDYHGKDLTATEEWETFEVLFSSLEQPGWTTKANTMDLDLTDVVQLAWQVHGEKNDVTEGVLDVDDVEIMNYTWKNPAMWYNTAPMDDTGSLKMFSNFEKAPKNQSVLGTYWYAYDDGLINGNSVVLEGAEKNETTKLLNLKFEDGTGPGDEGTAPLLNFKLGKTIVREEDAVRIQAFVGIGVNVYDSASSEYFDASNQKAIYFHYKTAGAVKKATMEISDSNDVADADHPNRKEKRGSGVVWYRDLPNTNEEWKAVKIPLDSLVAHQDWDVYKHIPLVKSALAKIQFKVQGAEGTEGFISVDNIYFTDRINGSSPVKPTAFKAGVSPLNASFRNGKISINWAGKSTISEGKISLIDAKGCVVQSSSITKTSKISDRISANTLASGIYIVRLSGVDTNGKAVSMQTSLNVIK